MNMPTVLLLLITSLFAVTWNKDAMHREVEGQSLARRPVIERNAVAMITDQEQQFLAQRNNPTFNIAGNPLDAEGAKDRTAFDGDSILY